MRSVSALVLTCLVALPTTAFAQAKHYQPIRVDTTFAFDVSPGPVPGYGGGVAVEPKFNLLDNLSLGLRFEAVVMGSGGISTGSNTSVNVGMRLVAAILAKGEWFFTTTGSRPFVGLALGDFVNEGLGGGTSGASIDAGNGFGLMPEVGVNFGGFRLAVEYHVIFGDALVTISAGNTERVSRNYLGISLGFRSGGARLGAR